MVSGWTEHLLKAIFFESFSYVLQSYAAAFDNFLIAVKPKRDYMLIG